jgi:hypothetical protein
MKALAGSVVVFAGAVLFAGGALADTVAEAAKTHNAPGGTLAMIAGVGAGLAGAFVLAAGWKGAAKRQAGLDPNDGTVTR